MDCRWYIPRIYDSFLNFFNVLTIWYPVSNKSSVQLRVTNLLTGYHQKSKHQRSSHRVICYSWETYGLMKTKSFCCDCRSGQYLATLNCSTVCLAAFWVWTVLSLICHGQSVHCSSMCASWIAVVCGKTNRGLTQLCWIICLWVQGTWLPDVCPVSNIDLKDQLRNCVACSSLMN